MRTVEDCLKAAWAALLRGDTDERDRQCELAEHILRQEAVWKQQGKIDLGQPILVDTKGVARPKLLH